MVALVLLTCPAAFSALMLLAVFRENLPNSVHGGLRAIGIVLLEIAAVATKNEVSE